MFEARRRFIVTTWEGGGSVGPALTVARKLVDAGHDVRVISDACNRPEAEASGVRFLSWTRAPSRADRERESELIRDWAGATIAEGLGQALMAICVGRAQDYAEDLIEELRREPADLVIGSDLILGVALACEVMKQPCVVLACNSLMFPADGAPQAGPPMTPEQRDAMQPVLEQVGAVFAMALPTLNRARAHFGLVPIDNLWDQLLIARKTLIAVSRTFDFGPDRDDGHFVYVGPQLDEVRWAETGRAPEVMADGRPLILVSFSTTFQNHIGILQKVVDALGQLPVRGLVTLGPAIRPHDLAAPANVELVRSAPHDQVMPNATLVVTHGGHGTVARGLLHHLPMLVIPHGRDQDGNAARVVAHGAGLMLPPTAQVEQIGAALRTLLKDRAYAQAAALLGSAMERDMRGCDIMAELTAACAMAVA